MNVSPLDKELGVRTDVVYGSTKTYVHSVGLSCAFRQWRAESHCRFLHGYALQVKCVFETKHLDQNNWAVDFGSLKSFKSWLEETFDHKTLVAKDDPSLPTFRDLASENLIQLREVPGVGCEAFSRIIFENLEKWLFSYNYLPRVQLVSVEVSEHGGNSAYTKALGTKST